MSHARIERIRREARRQCVPIKEVRKVIRERLKNLHTYGCTLQCGMTTSTEPQHDTTCWLCKAIFPRLNPDTRCPCQRYSGKYLKEVGRQIVKNL